MAKGTSKTEHLRNLVKREIRDLEKRGYRFTDELKEKVKSAKYQTLESYHKKGYKKLYGEATAEHEGEVVSGAKKRQQERAEAAKKGVKTRKQNEYLKELEKWKKEVEGTQEKENTEFNWVKDAQKEKEKQWEEERRKRDEFEKRYAEQYQEGEMVLDNLFSLISQYPGDYAFKLHFQLTEEIGKYGKTHVVLALAQAPEDAIANAKKIIFYFDYSKNEVARAYRELFGIISGTVPTEEEAKEMGYTMDAGDEVGEY